MNQIEILKIFEFVRNGASIKQDSNKRGLPITRIETIWNETIDSSRFGFADIQENDIGKYEKYLLEEGDILMTHINSPKHLGKCAMYSNEPPKLIHGMNLLCLRSNKKISFPKYLKYYFNSKFFKSQLPKISNQSVNQASFSAGNLKKLKIPLPSLPEQKKIAAILDAADEYRQKTKALIAKYDDLAQSLFLDMFNIFFKKKDSFLPISELTTFIDYRGKTLLKVKEGIPYITAKSVRIGRFDFKRLDYISKETYNEIMTRGYPKIGDVLFTTEGATMGFTCRIPSGFDKFSVGQRLITLQTKDNYNSTVLEFILNSKEIQGEIFRLATGSAVKGIRAAKFKTIKIPVPPIKLQNEFAERIKEINAQKEQAQKSLEESENLFNALLQKAFKGELT